MILQIEEVKLGWRECEWFEYLTLLPGGFCFSLPEKVNHGRSGLNFRVQLI